MSDELESLASAHLDDELPPEERAAVERAAAVDAGWTEELRSLAAVRDLVGSLPRPRPVDVSKSVMARITAPRRVLALPATTSPRVAAATAAGLLAIAFGLASPSLFHGDRPVPAPESVPSPVVSDAAPTAIVDEPPVDPEPAGPPIPSPVPTAVAVQDRGAAILDLLGRSAPHRLFLISAEDGQVDSTETASLLEISSHRDFFRLDPVRGDRGNSSSASAFIAELDPNELDTLRNRLSGAFAGRLDEVEADRRILTELASVSRATALRAAPAGEIHFPRNQMALQSAAVGGLSPTHQIEVERTERGSPPAPSSPILVAPDSEHRPTIVLIWFIAPASP